MNSGRFAPGSPASYVSRKPLTHGDQCNFRIGEVIHVCPSWRFNNWADCWSNRKAHRSRQGTRRLSGDNRDRCCWVFCRLLPRKTPWLDFRQSRQLAAGRLYPIIDRGRYPAACLPLDTPAIRALNATSLGYGSILTQLSRKDRPTVGSFASTDK